MNLYTIPKNLPVKVYSIIYMRYRPTHFRVGDVVFDRRDCKVGYYVRVHNTDIIITDGFGNKELVPIEAAYRLEPIYSLN